MKNWKILAFISILCFSTAALAQEVNYQEMANAGFADVAELFKSMTPQQQTEILKQAAIKQEDLKQLTPAQLEALRAQLHHIKDTIYVDQIDPAKLDPAKSKSTKDIQKDLDTYQQKYEQGKIKNSAVKPPGN